MIYGDGWMIKKKNTDFTFCHSLKQKEYALWKLELLKRYCSVRKYAISYKKHIPAQICIRVSVHHKLNSAYRRTYENDKKVIKLDGLKKISDLSLAIWFMDDGTFIKRFKTRTGKLKENPYISQIRLCTHSFSLEENQLIQKFLKNKFNLEFRIYTTKGKERLLYYLAYVGKENVNKFIGIVKPYIELCPSMLYKITI